MPVPLISLVAGLMEKLRLRFFPVATDQLRQLALDNVTRPDAVHSAFGFVPRTMDGELLYLRRTKKRQEP
jgi:phenylalanine-4-hydroxylase